MADRELRTPVGDRYRAPTRMSPRSWFWSLAALAALVAGGRAFVDRWIADSLWLAMRAASHFVAGQGLVGNPGPDALPLPGADSFVLGMVLACGRLVGAGDDALAALASALGALALASGTLLLAAFAWRSSGGRARLPLGSMVVAASPTLGIVAGGGSEAVLLGGLLVAMLRFCCAVRCAREAWLLGFLAVLAALTSPGAGWFGVVAFGCLAHDAVVRRSQRLLLGAVVPWLVVYAPYAWWRLQNGGNVRIPVVDGALVLQVCLALLPLWLGIVPALVFAVRAPDLLASISPFLGRRPWLALLALGVVGGIGVAVAPAEASAVGGLVASSMVLAAGLDLLCLRWRAAGLPFALACVLVPWAFVGWGDEAMAARRSAALQRSAAGAADGDALARVFAGLEVALQVDLQSLELGCRAQPEIVVLAPDDDRRLHFTFAVATDGLPDEAWRRVQFLGRVPARLLRYEPDLVAELRRRDPGFQCVDLPSFLDGYLQQLEQRSKAEVAADLAAFRRVWFDGRDDARLAVLTAFLQR
jgi:hypothetical protein